MKIEVDQLPDELARALFEALRLEIRHNRDTNTITAASRTAQNASVITLDAARQGRQQCNKRMRNRVVTHRVTTLFSSLWCPRQGAVQTVPTHDGGSGGVCQTSGVTRVEGNYLRPMARRPSKAISNAFN
ncbi:hypothetical protein JOD27_008949, partial [Lentzea nigeriaca]|uniref:hypothetical protein n=1 Tax=Lentzea nigeriaca TaxID=1128665 RepID=UPI001957A631